MTLSNYMKKLDLFDKHFVRVAQQSTNNKYANAVESYLKEMDFIRAISRKGE